ncbi:hypothetical protein BLOT_014680 [Blomia tropicalis]|nr:hypothetical protein BLOT_014680 [Blomia tropicalis]
MTYCLFLYNLSIYNLSIECIAFAKYTYLTKSKSKGFYPIPKFKRHLYVHLANAMQSYGNGHKNIEYNNRTELNFET